MLQLKKNAKKKQGSKSNLQLERNRKKTRDFLEKWSKNDSKKK